MTVEVAVIGGGPLGLMALKNFREDGFSVTLYETRAWVGGLWKYSEDEALSVGENTIFNSSKYRTAISDFPCPEDMDDFPTAPQLLKYLESYCDHFDLWPYIRLNSVVKTVKRAGAQWALQIESKSASTQIEYFDKVCFSCGPFVSPRQPSFDGIDLFHGNAFHSVKYHNPSQFQGQNVLVVGAHASAQDVITSLSNHARKAYLSHRAGVHMLPQYTNDGSVYDRMPPLNFTIFTVYLSSLFPAFHSWMMDKLIKMMSKKSFPNPPASLGSIATTPTANVTVTPPLIASALYRLFVSGFAEGVPEVKRITGPKTVELINGRVLEDIDTIIYCTGYHSSIPVDLEPQELNPYAYVGAAPRLYRNIFSLHPDESIRNSIVFLGQGALALPGFAPHEMQSLCVSQIWLGNSSLPSLAEMERWHRDLIKWRENQIKKYNAGSTFFTLFVPMSDSMIWLDSCAGTGIRHYFGLLSRWTNWRAWRFWWRDRKLYNICLTGVTSPAIFRLFDFGKRKPWKGAREQIFIDNERVQRQQRERLESLKKKDE